VRRTLRSTPAPVSPPNWLLAPCGCTRRIYSSARTIFKRAADLGDVESMMYLGSWPAKGEGRTSNFKEHTTGSCKRPTPEQRGHDDIGLLVFSGHGRRRVQRRAELVPKARNSAIARPCSTPRSRIAMAGRAVSYADAMTWLRRGAATGDAIAMNEIGVFYQKGLGVAVDYAEAMSWYLRSADAGCASAMYNAGLLYEGSARRGSRPGQSHRVVSKGGDSRRCLRYRGA